MKVPFPILGLHEGQPSIEQPQQTSFSIQNCRAFSVVGERLRGGKRSGTALAYTAADGEPLGGEHPILYMTSIVTTYIEPEAV